MIFTCKKCKKRLEIKDDKLHAGSAFVCPNCRNSIRVKEQSVVTPPPILGPSPIAQPPTPPVIKTAVPVLIEPRWLFPWILLGIWSAWLLVVPAFFLWSVLSYDFIYGDRVFLDSGQNFDLGGWVFGSIVQATMLAVALGVPGLIASVVAYFFIPKPTASH